MTVVESERIKIERSAESIFHFLSDLRNYSHLIPTEMGEVTAEKDEASIKLKGLGDFHLSILEKRDNSFIKLLPKGKLPFKFDIEWHLVEDGAQAFVQGKINADLNVFMKMMAESKLRDFVDKQAHKLKSFLENEIAE